MVINVINKLMYFFFNQFFSFFYEIHIIQDILNNISTFAGIILPVMLQNNAKCDVVPINRTIEHS